MTSETRHTIDPKFVMKRQGKDMVLYQGLLDCAHRAGMLSMATEILQYPCAENDHTTIVHARATFPYVIDHFKGEKPVEITERRTFDGIGDANPRNVGANIAPHAIRMAETRAKARALRDALNVGMVTVEELGGDDRDEQPDALANFDPRRLQDRPRRPPHPADDGFGPAPSKPAPLDTDQVLIILGEMDEGRTAWHEIKRYADDQSATRYADDQQKIHAKLKAIADGRRASAAPAPVPAD